RISFRMRIAVLFAVLWSAAVAGATPGEVDIGGLVGDARLQGLNGPSRQLSEFRGKPLLINFWASWCGPCCMEMGSLERLAWREEAAQFTVIGISTDDYPERALAFLRRSNATLNHYIDTGLQMENWLGAEQLPLTVLIDAKGTVLDKIYG